MNTTIKRYNDFNDKIILQIVLSFLSLKWTWLKQILSVHTFRNLKYLLYTFIFVLFCSPMQADIIESRDIGDLLKYAECETLVVLDLNNTLMRTYHFRGSDQWAAQIIKAEMESKGLTKEEVLHEFVPSWHQILRKSWVKPVEKKTARVIRTLQQREVKLVGLTARYIEMAYPTHEQLQSIDIDLSRSTVYHTDIEIEGGYAAKFIEGIIFAGLKNDKGETLFRFLDQVNFHPKAILFADDQLKNVKSVKAAATKRNIPFTGLRYAPK